MQLRFVSLVAFLAFLLVLLFVATTPGVGPPKPQGSAVEWSDLRGRIVWQGDPIPQPRLINVNRDQNCCLQNGPILSEELVVNPKNRGVRWVMAWLLPEPGEPARPLPTHPFLHAIKTKRLVLEQSGCRYVPHVLAMREGQGLIVKCRDDVPHTLKVGGSDGGFAVNYLLTPQSEKVIDDLKVGQRPYIVSCSLHNWMTGFFWVFDHPYFAITDADGNFEIRNAPVGRWRLKLWHQETGWRATGKNGKPITIGPEKVTRLRDFNVSALRDSLLRVEFTA